MDQKQPWAIRSSAKLFPLALASRFGSCDGSAVESFELLLELLLVIAEIAPTANAPTTTAPQKSEDCVEELTVERSSTVGAVSRTLSKYSAPRAATFGLRSREAWA